MQKLQNKKGFTLIELLVVITIIGILATGATTTYTSQIQKARDTTRINDLKALQGGIEQFYQDESYYPTTDATNAQGKYFSGVTTYLPNLPKDPKSGELCNKGDLTTATACDYIYAVSSDNNNINFGEYKISTGFENTGNVSGKAKGDGGATTETNRMELGLDIADTKSTLCNRTSKLTNAGITPISTSNCAEAITNTDGNGSLMISGS